MTVIPVREIVMSVISHQVAIVNDSGVVIVVGPQAAIGNFVRFPFER